jgi:N-methylhydantoinase B
MNPIELSLFSSRIEAVCDEMGAVLQRSAFSPNIKDRLDYSCAVFDAHGRLTAQAAHIPVHIGSMAYAMRDVVAGLQWHAGDMVILNDPFMGGTHLPDVTVIAPLFVDAHLVAYVVNRAHHADIGAATPGSMPISRRLEDEGMVIPPTFLVKGGAVQEEILDGFTANTTNAHQTRGDFAAQVSANRTGLARLEQLVLAMGLGQYQQAVAELNDYAERVAQAALSDIPDGVYSFEDCMDDDGAGHNDLRLCATIHIQGHHAAVDFDGTAAQTPGNVNCPLSVAAAGVYYVFRCLMPAYTPNCEGAFRSVMISAPEGCLLNARRPAAVAAGNVETSTRVVDVVMGALAKAAPGRIPAASHGSMNNLAMGARTLDHGQALQWDYYETIGGGMGAGPEYGGLSAVQTHMTNTRNTPVEVIEMNYPVRVNQYAVRLDSGGCGIHNGGDGIVREFDFLQPATVTLITERRLHRPWGISGGKEGEPGENAINAEVLAPKITARVERGDRLTIKTPGGGGWGAARV